MAVSLLDEASAAGGVRLRFDQGDICKRQSAAGQTEMGSRIVNFDVKCAGDDGRLDQIEEVSMCEYTIHFSSKAACPVASGRGRTFRLAVFLGFVFLAYCAGGVAYNHHYHGQPVSADAIPHREMWREVPGLVKDGVAFSQEQSKVALEYAREKYQQYRGQPAGL
jgi:hypothetical protein